ncbi:5E5 antigen-like isoform X1 [Bos javanicus]|uniref:5E5 antigen-like isoform X1 n=1 Tax=Bos javanicus TaxID=9906 RepID=UPI002AA615B6|nr:5E5 antigen-like isoform X1 [Bos javanicus]
MLDAARPRPPAPPPLPPGALHRLYAWLDALPPSRRKRHLARDFSDGVMLAEVVKLFGPRLVDLHKYVPTCNTGQKRSNWSVLNRKVFHKLGLSVSGRDPKGDRQHPWGHRAHPVCSEGQGGGLEDPPGTAGHVGTITWPWPLLCWDTGSLPADESKTRNRGALAAPGPWAAAAAAGGEGAGAGSPAGDRQGAGLGALQVAWPSMRRGRGSQAGPLTGGARECIPEIPRSRGESTVGHHPSETDQPALPVIRHQRPRVRGCRLTGLATQTYWTAGSRALGPSQGAEDSADEGGQAGAPGETKGPADWVFLGVATHCPSDVEQPRRTRASVSTSRGLAPPDCTSRVPSRCGLRFPCCPPPPRLLPTEKTSLDMKMGLVPWSP